jgi:hypothetical protein
MKTEYDLSKIKSRKNPYAVKLKKSVTMWLSEELLIISNKWRMKKVSHIRAL